MGQKSNLNFPSSSFSNYFPRLQSNVEKGCRCLKTLLEKDLISKFTPVVVGKNQFLVNCKNDTVPYWSLGGRHPQSLAMRATP